MSQHNNMAKEKDMEGSRHQVQMVVDLEKMQEKIRAVLDST